MYNLKIIIIYKNYYISLFEKSMKKKIQSMFQNQLYLNFLIESRLYNKYNEYQVNFIY